MLNARTGLSRLAEPHAAGVDAASQAKAALAQPATSLLVFVSQDHALHLRRVLQGVMAVFGEVPIAAASGAGVLTEAAEVEEGPAVALLAIVADRLRLTARQFPPAEGRDLGERLVAYAHQAADVPQALLWMPGDNAGWPEEVLQGFGEAGGSLLPVLGAGLSGSWQVSATAVDDEVCEGGSLAILVQGQAQVRYGLSPAMGPFGRQHRVTQAHGDRVEQLDGHPALAVLMEEAPPAIRTAVDQGEMPVFLSLLRQGDAESSGQAYSVRSVLGVDPRDGSLIVPQLVSEGQSVGFLVQDRERALADFSGLLDQLAAADGSDPAFAIYYNCAARGRDLYGAGDVDVAAIRQRLPGLPVIGLFGAYELCPVAGINRMHSYTGVLALVGEAAVG